MMRQACIRSCALVRSNCQVVIVQKTSRKKARFILRYEHFPSPYDVQFYKTPIDAAHEF